MHPQRRQSIKGDIREPGSHQKRCGCRNPQTGKILGIKCPLCNQIAQHGWEPVQKKPKSNAGDREVALDVLTVEVIHQHLEHQRQLAKLRGFAWHDTGMVFTDTDGRPLHPAYVTAQFKRLIEAAGLPPIRLHDLRHGAASIADAAGVDIKTISKQLGHSSIAITADTYTAVFAEVDHAAAESVASVVPLRRKPQRSAA